VGHPLVDLARAARPREEVLSAAGLDPGRPVVALLPGSRASELRHILPTMSEAAALIAARVSGVQFLVARAPSLADDLFEPLTALASAGVPVSEIAGDADGVLASAEVAITASGTATVQAAMHGTPMVVVYRLSPLTYAIGRTVVRVDHYCMVNLIAGRRVVPELVQESFTPERVAAETVPLIVDPGRRAAMQAELAAVRAKLGGPGASARAAQAVLETARARVIDPVSP
jgi:lipid-A-disaccharide synthase